MGSRIIKMSLRKLQFSVIICFLLVLSDQLDRYSDRKCRKEKQKSYSTNEQQCQIEKPPCGLCGCPIDVNLTAKNVLQEPYFEISVQVTNEPKRELLSFLEKAAELSNGFRFKATYYTGLGYFIDSINGLEGSVPNQTFWHFSSGGVSLTCGASSYVPRDGEIILFNFTTYTDVGFH